jgi:hypothetical protein
MAEVAPQRFPNRPHIGYVQSFQPSGQAAVRHTSAIRCWVRLTPRALADSASWVLAVAILHSSTDAWPHRYGVWRRHDLIGLQVSPQTS